MGISVQITKDPVGLYLAAIKALSDEKNDIMKDDRRFTDYVSRYDETSNIVCTTAIFRRLQTSRVDG